MTKLAGGYFLANAQANKYKALAEKTRCSLLALMQKNDVKTDTFSYTVKNDEGNDVTMNLVATVSTAVNSTVDISLLKPLVPEDVFMKIISATQTSVKDMAGGAILAQCLVEKQGTTNVSVKKA